MEKQVRVGIGALICRDNRILLGKRINSHGMNTWSPPGGHLEWFEDPIESAKREVLEETGLTLTAITAQGQWTNDKFTKEQKHYITLFMLAHADGEPVVKEPDKCLEWQWFDIDDLPSPLFLPLTNLLSQHSTILHEYGEAL